MNALLLLREGRNLVIPPLAELVRKKDPAITPRAATILGRYGAASGEAVPALVEVIEEAGPAAAACRDALVQIGPSAVPEILRAVAGKDASVIKREHWSVQTLAAIGAAALPSIRKGFASPSVTTRVVAARACAELGIEAAPARDELFKLCGDADASVRAASLAAVAALPLEAKQLQPRIENALKDASPLVRRTAVQIVPSLGEAKRAFGPALVTALKDDDATVREAALLAIGPDQPEAVPVLVELLATPPMRAPALAALAKLGAAAAPATRRLAELYPHAEKKEQLTILEIASNSASNESLALLSGAMKESDAEIRAAALGGFARAQSDKTVSATTALSMLRDSDQDVRRAAAAALGRLGDAARDSATMPLIALLDNDQDREFALEALRDLRIRTVPTLLPLLDHRDARVRVFACERLARAGADAREAIPILQKLAQTDAQPDFVRREARRAVQQIERR
jgi:HEAT repeat protein